ncbi:MAG: DUF4230 domain-containing protein [Bacteroidales bacterium]|nr:DUF4230 domain-containing protein [Candidatus Cacconaster merdequi]
MRIFDLPSLKWHIKCYVLLIAISAVSSCGPSVEDEVALKVSSISEMSEVGTVEYTVAKIIKASDDAWYKYGDRKVLFTSVSYLKTGIDMKDFSADDIVVDKISRKVEVTLPKARLLSFNMPPEKIRLVYSKVSGLRFNFTPEELQDIKKQGEMAVLADVPNLGILQDAEQNAREFFESSFASLGYETTVIFK